MKASPFSRFPVLAGAVAISVIFDQLIKYLVETSLPLHQAIPVVPFLALYRTYNTGIAFSMLSGLGGVGLAVLALGVMIFVLYLWRNTPPGRWLAHPGYVLILGGALGNLIDRTWHGHVIDYVLFHAEKWSFAVFNLADAFISVGAALVILDELVELVRQRRPN